MTRQGQTNRTAARSVKREQAKEGETPGPKGARPYPSVYSGRIRWTRASGLKAGPKARRTGGCTEHGKPDAGPTREAAGRGRCKKRTAFCNETHSPSGFGAFRKEADLHVWSRFAMKARAE